MKGSVLAVSVVLVSSLLTGCTAGAPPGPHPSGPLDVSPTSVSGSDLGNGRPQVSFDGLMVRRRIVVALHPAPDSDLEKLRTALSSAADSLGVALSRMSPDVLGAGLLQHTVPEIIVALPGDATIDDGGELVNLAFGPDLSFPGLDHVHVAQVLVHDLRFTVSSADPGALSEAIALEGILSDALGNYDTDAGDGELELSYTGPLLSDKTIEAVRIGIASGAGSAPEDVKVSARLDTGTGVDMEKEPAEAAAAAFDRNPVHGH
ncbi:hypothetical protein QFZ36_001450 [Pseudarthrobacter siccitolerans]|uniref:Lipoprotein n=1 Tax=Pseudarthrobacter siccitolerans TaxID=861266 RepID=A0ABU0PIV0_9MICC|nr:hypothetical protein [Pseudarthrobacter siccitolerans]MDQ0673889.1 hypothetical protein [Pseudarthrobacter siccitolerans]